MASPVVYVPFQKVGEYKPTDIVNFQPQKPRTRILKRGYSSSAIVTVYTVPKGFNLYIISCWISQINDGTGVGSVDGTMYIGSTNESIIEIITNIDAGLRQSQNNAYFGSYPIELNAGEAVMLRGGADCTDCAAGFYGYLEPIS